MIHQVEVQVLAVLFVAALVGMGARRLRLPYTLALVVVGFGLGGIDLEALDGLALTPEVLLLLLLPPLLFEAAFHLSLKEFRRNRAQILSLAVPGVLIATGLTAGLTWLALGATGIVPGMGWGVALIFASVIVATDPISVLAIFKELGAPRRLYVIVEGESLLNDGVAVVVFGIVLTVLGVGAAEGVEVEVLRGAGEILRFAVISGVKTGLGGVLIGGIVGGVVSLLTRQVDDHLIEVTLTTVVAWGSFLLAEELHVSGVLSTVTAGMVMGSFGSHYGMGPSTRVAVQDFWAYMGFLSNSFIFLLLGLELESQRFLILLPASAVAFVAVVAVRALLVYGFGPVVDRFAEPLPAKWRPILVWGGLRGSLSMVLVLGLPASFVHRSLLVDLVFGVVALSLFLQGLTMPRLMRRQGLSAGVSGELREYELERGRVLAAKHALDEMIRLQNEGLIDEPSVLRLRAWYEARHDGARKRARALADDNARPDRLLEAAKALADVERESVRHSATIGVLSNDVASELLVAIDDRMHALADAAHEGDEALAAAVDLALQVPPGTGGDAPAGPR